ncbi:hypothetical protein EGW08_007048 [Elysia chlorotica]|uniref:Uncharacterized protein n=1 Tax=Elysia chlorotica TaxID=188477 RepID=A0A433TUH8_ELYCH|nr:hypothetical protein EGW08_007048 [Elysia chlorotica]
MEKEKKGSVPGRPTRHRAQQGDTARKSSANCVRAIPELYSQHRKRESVCLLGLTLAKTGQPIERCGPHRPPVSGEGVGQRDVLVNDSPQAGSPQSPGSNLHPYGTHLTANKVPNSRVETVSNAMHRATSSAVTIDAVVHSPQHIPLCKGPTMLGFVPLKSLFLFPFGAFFRICRMWAMAVQTAGIGFTLEVETHRKGKRVND